MCTALRNHFFFSLSCRHDHCIDIQLVVVRCVAAQIPHHIDGRSGSPLITGVLVLYKTQCNYHFHCLAHIKCNKMAQGPASLQHGVFAQAELGSRTGGYPVAKVVAQNSTADAASPPIVRSVLVTLFLVCRI